MYYDRYIDTLLTLGSPSNLFVNCRFGGLENAKNQKETLCVSTPLLFDSSRQQEEINLAAQTSNFLITENEYRRVSNVVLLPC